MKQRTARNTKREQRKNSDAPAGKSRYAKKVRAGNQMYGPAPRVAKYPDYRIPHPTPYRAPTSAWDLS